MTKIKNTVVYKTDNPVNGSDYVIGTVGQPTTGYVTGQTRNFTLDQISAFVQAGLSPDEGGTFKITELLYNGVLTDVVAVANSLSPAYTVARYELVILNVNGDRYILKLQDVVIGLGETPTSSTDFITLIGLENIGGQSFMKGYNVATGKHEFYGFTSTGNTITVVGNNINIEPKAGVNLWTGINLYAGLEASTKLHEFITIGTSTMKFTKQFDGGGKYIGLLIDTPQTSVIQGLYVNKLYVPTYDDWLAAGGDLITNPTFEYKGDGTIAKPFTDTIKYTSISVSVITANSAIQNGLDAYVGTGTRLAPQMLGQRIIVQDAGSSYTHVGDYNYNGIDIEFQGNSNNTNSGLIMDLDNATYFSPTNMRPQITLNEGVIFQATGSGINNSGNTVATNNFANGRTLRLLGTGLFFCPTNDATKYIINSDPLSTGNGTTGFNNDGEVAFDIQCDLRSDYGGVWKVGGISRIDVYGECISGTLQTPNSTALKAYLQTGGAVRVNSSASIRITGTGTRVDGICFTPTNGFTPSFKSINSKFTGKITNMFTKTTADATSLFVTDSISGDDLVVANTFECATLWSVYFTNNVMQNGFIDDTKADLTGGNSYSAVNTIGNDIIESLCVYSSRVNAIAAGRVKGSAFINRKTVLATAMVAGNEYQILTTGTSNFVTYGASANTVGINFTANAVGTGTGTVYEWTRDILI
ncbi:MAG: hypothetical protein KBC56_07255 [Flavobacterium sp.]|nr:hypothetical protein [Flavobacterium sp.]